MPTKGQLSNLEVSKKVLKKFVKAQENMFKQKRGEIKTTSFSEEKSADIYPGYIGNKATVGDRSHIQGITTELSPTVYKQNGKPFLAVMNSTTYTDIAGDFSGSMYPNVDTTDCVTAAYLADGALMVKGSYAGNDNVQSSLKTIFGIPQTA